MKANQELCLRIYICFCSHDMHVTVGDVGMEQERVTNAQRAPCEGKIANEQLRLCQRMLSGTD